MIGGGALGGIGLVPSSYCLLPPIGNATMGGGMPWEAGRAGGGRAGMHALRIESVLWMQAYYDLKQSCSYECAASQWHHVNTTVELINFGNASEDWAVGAQRGVGAPGGGGSSWARHVQA